MKLGAIAIQFGPQKQAIGWQWFFLGRLRRDNYPWAHLKLNIKLFVGFYASGAAKNAILCRHDLMGQRNCRVEKNMRIFLNALLSQGQNIWCCSLVWATHHRFQASVRMHPHIILINQSRSCKMPLGDFSWNLNWPTYESIFNTAVDFLLLNTGKLDATAVPTGQ